MRASACSSIRSSVDLCYVGCKHNKLLQPTAFAPVIFSAFSTRVLTPLNTAQDLGPSFNAFFRAIVLHPLSTRLQICLYDTSFQHASFLKNQNQRASYQYFWKNQTSNILSTLFIFLWRKLEPGKMLLWIFSSVSISNYCCICRQYRRNHLWNLCCKVDWLLLCDRKLW